jgi:hypothetical protein
MDVLEATVLVSPDVLVLQTVVRLGGLVFLAESLGAHFVSFVGRSRECTTITSRNDGKNCVDLCRTPHIVSHCSAMNTTARFGVLVFGVCCVDRVIGLNRL